MQSEWEIRAPSRQCNRCETPFADKSAYHTLLRFTHEGYTRRDLCPNCWTQEPKDGVVSTWQGVYRVPAPPPPEPIEKKTAESRLRELVNSTDPSHAGVRYILAVMLERKRILRHRDTVQQNGEDILIYEHAQTGETFPVVDPHLRLDQLDQLQKDVNALLGQGSATAT
jgi:hypothetical protein